ncbi:MAG TPA: tetratricopeptide repeat protein [Candidatus Limnocylindria bacterium]
MRRSLFAGLAIAALAVSLGAGSLVSRSLSLVRPAEAGDRNAASPGTDLDARVPRAWAGARSAANMIGILQGALAARPGDAATYRELGIAYLQRVRETGDPTLYPRAEVALRRALELDGDDFRTLAALGTLALSRHQFTDALDWGERARRQNPENAAVQGIIGDAQLELGRYEAAFATFERMVDLRPGLASYARISYARELLGDRPGAIEAMREATEAGDGNPEGLSWALVQLGNLQFDQGDVGPAQRSYTRALAVTPDYPYARAGLANVRVAFDDAESAIGAYARLVEQLPLPQFVIALGDLYASAGRPADAARAYALVDAERRLYEASGVDLDVEMALFDADHTSGGADGALRAGAAYERRPSIFAADAAAWACYRAGDYAAASELMSAALRLGTRSALLEYHAGAIAYRAGRLSEARDHLERALGLNPRFSVLYADDARALLQTLRATNTAQTNQDMR